MAESPERREELGRILMEYRLRAENAPSHAYGWALNEIYALFHPAPDAAMVERKALEHLLSTLCVGAFAIPIPEVARRIEALYRPAPDAAKWKTLAESSAHHETMLNDALTQEIKAVHKWKALAQELLTALINTLENLRLQRQSETLSASENTIIAVNGYRVFDNGLPIITKAREMGLKVEERK